MRDSGQMLFAGSLAIASLFVICCTSTLRADPIVFSDPLELLPTGTISYGGGSDPLIGSDIQIRQVKGPDGVKHPVHLVGAIGTGQLNFETGDFIGMSGSDLIFGGTGPDDFIQIYGTVPDAGVLGPPTPLLLSGTILGAIVDPQLGTIKLGLELGAGNDTVNPELLSYFGLPASSKFVFTTVLFTPLLDVQDGGSFDGKVISTTVSDYAIPEPSSLVLGLTTVALVMFRFGRTGRKRAT